MGKEMVSRMSLDMVCIDEPLSFYSGISSVLYIWSALTSFLISHKIAICPLS